MSSHQPGRSSSKTEPRLHRMTSSARHFEASSKQLALSIRAAAGKVSRKVEKIAVPKMLESRKLRHGAISWQIKLRRCAGTHSLAITGHKSLPARLSPRPGERGRMNEFQPNAARYYFISHPEIGRSHVSLRGISHPWFTNLVKKK